MKELIIAVAVMMQPLTITNKGLKLIKEFEGKRNHPYLDASGTPTIGYGNTRYADGTPVKLTDKPIREAEATKLLRAVVEDFEQDMHKHITVVLKPHQWDALVSFTYNVGPTAFKNSTLLQVINNNPEDFDKIETEFKKWVKVNGKTSKVLKKRRNREFYYYKYNKL